MVVEVGRKGADEVEVDALRCAGEGEAMVDAGGEFGLVVGDHHQGLSW